MTLDPTAAVANVKLSIKKAFITYFEEGNGIPVLFDMSEHFPDTTDKSLTEWVSVAFGSHRKATLSSLMFMVFPCTRNDPESVRLQQIADMVRDLIANPAVLYGSNWTDIGRISFFERAAAEGAFESLNVLKDFTKIEPLLIEGKWGARG